MAYVTELLWSEASEDHIARHGIEPEEVEQVALNPHYTRNARGGTYMLVGQTYGGRYLSVVVAPRGGTMYYVVTARDSNREERRQHSRWRGTL